MFHFVEGVPFESNSGVWDRLTMWEQIDGGEQYTPAKKWLTSLPICLWVFLLSFKNWKNSIFVRHSLTSGLVWFFLSFTYHFFSRRFLLSTHYTRYDHHPALFSLNLISLVGLALIPKLPQLHRQRLSFGSGESFSNGDMSTGANTRESALFYLKGESID